VRARSSPRAHAGEGGQEHQSLVPLRHGAGQGVDLSQGGHRSFRRPLDAGAADGAWVLRDAPILERLTVHDPRLAELYRYDFSEFDLDPHGEYGYRYLDHYWTEASRAPFLFRVDGYWAGFALVRAESPFDMSEFFVMRKYRRQGVGRVAAAELFRRVSDPWWVREQKTNPAATEFWRTAIRIATTSAPRIRR
jgi:predicted acetyltransferase